MSTVRKQAGPLPGLEFADAAFVTPHLAVGGDLDSLDVRLMVLQLWELEDAGITHIIDARDEWSDQSLVGRLAPSLRYLHHGMDDGGQEVPLEWFDEAVTWAVEAIQAGGVVLTHCHMGINRGPSLGFAVMLALGWDAVAALDVIRDAREIAYVAYAEDALRWHHTRTQATKARRATDQRRLAAWRATNQLDVADMIRHKRALGY